MSSPFKIPSSCEEGTWREGAEHWGHRDSDKWPEGFTKPRTCSYCGSVHPDDLIALVEQGWEFDPSTKSYKSYWQPPGFIERMNAALRDITQLVDGRLGEPRHVSPVPPVKLYHNHLRAEQADRINAMLKARAS